MAFSALIFAIECNQMVDDQKDRRRKREEDFGLFSELKDAQIRNQLKVTDIVCGDKVAKVESSYSDKKVGKRDMDAFGLGFRRRFHLRAKQPSPLPGARDIGAKHGIG